MASRSVLLALAAIAAVSVRADVASTVASLKTATNTVAQVNLLQDSDVSDCSHEFSSSIELTFVQFVFDFMNATAGVTQGAGGKAIGASVANFPALVGQGVAMTIGFLGQ